MVSDPSHLMDSVEKRQRFFRALRTGQSAVREELRDFSEETEQPPALHVELKFTIRASSQWQQRVRPKNHLAFDTK
jgi:hypothetical protein